MERRVGAEDKGELGGDVDAPQPREWASRRRRGRAGFSPHVVEEGEDADRWGRGKIRRGKRFVSWAAQ